MAQPAIPSSKDRTELLRVPSFWGKPSPESPLVEVLVGQFFFAVLVKENCNPTMLLSVLSVLSPVFDNPPRKT